MSCPGCGRPIPESKFLCNACADILPDAAVERIAAAVDDGDTVEAGVQIVAAFAELEN